MSDVSKLKIGDIEYDIKDSVARTHIANQVNPHNVTKAQVGLANVENLSSTEILNKLTSSNVSSALGYVPAKDSELDIVQETADAALEYSVEAKTAVLHKIDSITDSSVPAIVNFMNGIKVSGATISYDSVNDTINFN